MPKNVTLYGNIISTEEKGEPVLEKGQETGHYVKKPDLNHIPPISVSMDKLT